MSRKGENIYLRKDGRWEGRYIRGRKSGGACRYGYVYAKTYREAREKLAAKRSGTARTAAEPPEENDGSHTVSGAYLFGAAVREWLCHVQYQVKDSTFAKYRSMAEVYLIPALGGQPWEQITREAIETFCGRLLASGGRRGQGLAPKTVADILSVIRNIFRYASAHGHRPPCDLSYISIRGGSKEMRILSRREQRTLCLRLCADLTRVQEQPSAADPLHSKNLGILISLFTGLRIGELCALKWEDISLEEQTIYVHQTIQRVQTGKKDGNRTELRISSPKSRCSIRRIPISRELAAILAAFRKGRNDQNGFVLTGREDAGMEPRTMQRHFQRVLRETQLEPVNFHALRHTFATRCVEMNFDVKSLSEILGHASVNITMNRYVHPSMDLKRKNMQRLSELFAVR